MDTERKGKDRGEGICARPQSHVGGRIEDLVCRRFGRITQGI